MVLEFLALMPERMVQIWALFWEEPLVYFPMLGIWALFELYYIVSNDDNDVREVDVLDNGISSIYVAIMISPVIARGGELVAADFFSPTPRTLLSIGLFAYALFLILAAFFKFMPLAVVHFLGGASIDTFFTLIGLVYVNSEIPLDAPLITVILIPIGTTFIIKMLRRVTG